MNILAELQHRFAVALAGIIDRPAEFAVMVRPAQDRRFGDFQANCAMPLAKYTGGNPREIAAKIVERLSVDDLCLPPEIAGPGFINLTLRDDWLEGRVNAVLHDERLGVDATASPRKIIVDFSSPNVAKPMHVGHLRSTVIGDALCRVLKFLGHDVLSDNHIGDWGTQFGMIIYGYKHFLDEAAYRQHPVDELARLYRLVNQLADYHDAREKLPQFIAQQTEKQTQLKAVETSPDSDEKQQKRTLKKLRSEVTSANEEVASAQRKIAGVEQSAELVRLAALHPDIARAARDETAGLHAGDAENRQLWRRFVPQCLEALQRIYDRLEVRFDMTLGESHYDPFLADVVADLKSHGLATESDGAMCVFVEGFAAPFIVQKADGAFTYATTDLATIRQRVNEFHANTILYVVDARQGDHFKLLFSTARKWGYAETELQHVSFGTVMGEDGRPFKTRAGDTVGLESLLDEATSQARRIVAENDDAKPDGPELDDAARQAVAEVVGIGGIKYADLHHNRESDYVFSWQKMLAKNGDTATYMQYAYARACGILRRGGVDARLLRASAARVRFTHPAERALALKLCRFAEALDAVAVEYRPNLLTQYLFETANEFSTFYDSCPVLKEPDEAIRAGRSLLVDLTGRVIAQGLALLGIDVCEQM